MNLRRAPGGRPLVIGHRGAASVAPENTLASLEAAVAAGVDLVEFDIVRGLRLAHSRREAQRDALDLDDALGFLSAHGAGVHLDLKEAGLEEGVVAAVGRHALTGRALVSTALAGVSRRLAEVAPELPRAIGYPRDRVGVARIQWPPKLIAAGAAALRAAMPLRIAPLVRLARADVLALHHTLVSRGAVDRAHALGVPLLAWTVNEPDLVVRLASIGVDGIVTDDPVQTLATLNAL